MRSNTMLQVLFTALLGIALGLASCDQDAASTSDLALGSRTSHSFSYSANPTQTGEEVTITFDAGNTADCGLIHIQATSPEGDTYGGKPVTPEAGVGTLTFVPLTPGEYTIRAKYTRTGNPRDCDQESTGWLDADEVLLVEGDPVEEGGEECEASFTGEALNCAEMREVVFTYVPDHDYNHAKIQGGLTNGVLEDAVVTVEGADLDVEQWIPGQSTNRIIRLTGSVEACVPIVITVTWTSDNPGDVITGEWSATGDLEVPGLSCE